ncbi:hypothetical protein SLS62_003494 [Diatrype stigma]|uniref:Uncharacterized protein n=1 Tax=Diatrype stigma TaxID=117547 RepID=A0AAN9YU73_9PEZI
MNTGKYPPAVSPADAILSGKTAIITGANSGLVFCQNTELLRLDLSRLVITARDEVEGEAAEKARADEKPLGISVEVWSLDLADCDPMASLIQRVKTLKRPDFVIQNSGAFTLDFKKNPSTKHGKVIQVNYLSNALPCILLLPVLAPKKAKTPTRIVWVYFETAAWASFKRGGSFLFAALDKPLSFDFIDRLTTPVSTWLGST